MHSKDIYWLDKNFRDFFQNDMIFGGVPALFEGDNGQISSALAITDQSNIIKNGFIDQQNAIVKLTEQSKNSMTIKWSSHSS